MKIPSSRVKDITGNTYHHLTVLGYNRSSINTSYWDVRCVCGKEIVVDKGNLLKGSKKSCGCMTEIERKKISSTTGLPIGVKNIVGHKRGKLTVVSFAGTKDEVSIWPVRCECGNEKVLKVSAFYYSGCHTISCGCSGLENRFKKKYFKDRLAIDVPEHKVYASMLSRCYNPNSKHYRHYGGRGIVVSDDWRESFMNFHRDMGKRPDGMSLDRIDNNGIYCKENCRWASFETQAKNRRSSIYVDIDGKMMYLKDAANKLGVSYEIAYARFKRGVKINCENSRKDAWVRRKFRRKMMECMGG
jgi:hypothetical protein